MRRLRGIALLALTAAAGSLLVSAPSSSAISTSACAGRATSAVPGSGTVQVFAMQFKQEVSQVSTYKSIAGYVDCYFRRYVAPYRDRRLPGVVVFNELTSILFGVEGSEGQPARAFASSPGASDPGNKTGEPLGAVGGAIGLVAATHSKQLAFYENRFPKGPQSLSRVFLALTDTYVRSIWGSFAAAARRYRVTVVVGAPLPILDDARSCAAYHYRHWRACPGWVSSSSPVDVAALADPDLGNVHSVYAAVTPNVENVALVFGPGGRLTDLQPKVNLTPIENEIGWTPAPMATVHPIALAGAAGVRMGIAISLDAFEHTHSSHPCATDSDFVGCLAAQHDNLLLQPEFNDGTPQCASWSTFSTACGPPSWQQLGWMLSSWYDVGHFRSIRYAINPFMVGNLYDLTGDGQSAIFARSDRRARRGSYVGDNHPISLYPDPPSLAPYDGPQPGFLAVAPWVVGGRVRYNPSLKAGDRRSLESCEDGLVSGSHITGGPCRENAYLVTAITAKLRLP